MTNISQLIPIVAKSIADAETLNANFQFLNDEIKKISLSGLEKTVNKNQPNGYCGLDSNGKVPSNKVDNSSIDTAISNINTSLSSKMDENASNASKTAKQTITSWGFPKKDYLKENPTVNTTYTASENCWVYVRGDDNNGSNYKVLIDGRTMAYSYGWKYTTRCSSLLPVAKGKTYRVEGDPAKYYVLKCIGG